MAVRTPRIQPADPSVAVRVSTSVPSTTPQAFANIAGAVLEVNKERKLTALKDELTEHRAQFEGAVLGSDAVVQTAATKRALQDFASDAERLAKARLQLSPGKFNSQSEILLRKHQARAPGLSEEFRGVARAVLKRDPTGAGLEEAFAALKTQGDQRQDLVNELLAQAKRVKAEKAINAFTLNGDINQLAQALQPRVNAFQKRADAARDLGVAKDIDALDSIGAKRAGIDFVQSSASTFDAALQDLISPEASQDLSQALSNRDPGQLSDDTRLEIQRALTDLNDSIRGSTSGVFAKMTESQRSAAMIPLDHVTTLYTDFLEGKITGEAADRKLQLTENLLLNEITRDPEIVTGMANLAIVEEHFRSAMPIFLGHAAKLGVQSQAAAKALSGRLQDVQEIRGQTVPNAEGKEVSIQEAWNKATAGIIASEELPEETKSDYIQNFVSLNASTLADSATPDEALATLTNLVAAISTKEFQKSGNVEQAQASARIQATEILGNTLDFIGKGLGREAKERGITFSVQDGKVVAKLKSGQELSQAIKDVPSARQLRSFETLVRKFNTMSGLVSQLGGSPEESLAAIREQYLTRSGEARDGIVKQIEAAEKKLGVIKELPAERTQRARVNIRREIQNLQEQLEGLGEEGGTLETGATGNE